MEDPTIFAADSAVTGEELEEPAARASSAGHGSARSFSAGS